MFSTKAAHHPVRSGGQRPSDRPSVGLLDSGIDQRFVLNQPAVAQSRFWTSGGIIASAADSVTELGRSVAEALDTFGRTGGRSGIVG